MMSLLPVVMITAAAFAYCDRRDMNCPEAKAERAVLSTLDKINSGERYITVAEPLAGDVEKLLKDEHYEFYMKLPDSKRIIYEKNNKAVDKTNTKEYLYGRL